MAPGAEGHDTGSVPIPPLAGADFRCTLCAMHYPEITPAAAAAMVRQQPPEYRAAFRDRPDDVVRRRPDPATWSMIEYACHVRDVFAVSVDRIHLALTADNATFEPLGNDDRAIRLAYDQAAVDETLDDLATSAVRLADLLDALGDDAWDHTASRLPGEERDVRWMARQAAHEGRHHLHDIERVAQPRHAR
jgi:hypothetical protein